MNMFKKMFTAAILAGLSSVLFAMNCPGKSDFYLPTYHLNEALQQQGWNSLLVADPAIYDSIPDATTISIQPDYSPFLNKTVLACVYKGPEDLKFIAYIPSDIHPTNIKCDHVKITDASECTFDNSNY